MGSSTWQVAATYMQVSKRHQGIGASIGQAFTAARENGSLDQIFGSLPEMLGGIGDLLNGAWFGLDDHGRPSRAGLGPLLHRAGQRDPHRRAEPRRTRPRLHRDPDTDHPAGRVDLVKAFAEGLKPVLPVIGQLIAAIIPAITPWSTRCHRSRPSLVAHWAEVDHRPRWRPAIGPARERVRVDHQCALAPIIPVVADFISMLVQAPALAVTVIFQALAPVIKQLAEKPKPVFEQMMPIIAETAGIIALALADRDWASPYPAAARHGVHEFADA